MSIIIEEKQLDKEPVGSSASNRYSDLRNMLERCGLRVRNGVLQSDNYVAGTSGFAFRTVAGTIEALTIVAGNYVQTFVADDDAIPTSVHIGDLWICSNQNNKVYRAASVGADQITAGEWILYGTLANWSEIVDDDSNKPADNATATYQTFYASTAPASGMVTGDYWVDSDDNKLYRYAASAWGEIQDDAIATAITNAATAQSEAESKIRTFIQASAPTAENTGDLWYDSDDDNKVYRWSSSAWVSAQDLAASWALVTGANKPEDSATVGAKAGDDLVDSGDTTLEDEDIIKYAGTIYGDGSDGDLTTSGNVTLTADTYYDTLTISAGDTVTTAGFRLFCKTKLIIAATGVLDWSGNDGTAGDNPNKGAGGAGLVDGNLIGSHTGGEGGSLSCGNGDAGGARAVSIGVNGGAGGDSACGSNGDGGAGGVATQSPTKPRAYPFCVQLSHIADNVVPQSLDGSAGSGGGGGGGNQAPGGGGGSAGGMMLVVAREIENAGAIQVHGGDGGDGDTDPGEGIGAGGGAGGSGGVLILIYNKYSGAGTKTATEGTGGAGGFGSSQSGAAGSNGNTGVIIELPF